MNKQAREFNTGFETAASLSSPLFSNKLTVLSCGSILETSALVSSCSLTKGDFFTLNTGRSSRAPASVNVDAAQAWRCFSEISSGTKSKDFPHWYDVSLGFKKPYIRANAKRCVGGPSWHLRPAGLQHAVMKINQISSYQLLRLLLLSTQAWSAMLR